jgi:hypothetical protein
MQKTFKPSICDGTNYEGEVKIRPLSFDERIEIFDECGIDSAPEGADQRKMGMKLMASIGKRSKDFVKEVNIKRLSDGVMLTWDDIYYDGEMTSTVVEVCTAIMGKS